MGRHQKPPEHLNHEAWAIPYADLITLLLAFFVVMYAISTVNESKYRVLSDSLSVAFSAPSKIATALPAGDQVPRAVEAVQGDPTVVQLPPIPLPLQLSAQRAQAQAKRELAQGLENELAELLQDENMSIHTRPDGIEITVASDFLFASGSAQIQGNAVPLLQQIANALLPLPYPVRVEGHTDNVPIATRQFPSNWELSADRAAWVVRLLAENGLAPARLSMLGYAEYRPRASNAEVQGRQANRRVGIIVEFPS